jgi:ATP-binding cassette subfamily F protein uup
LATQSLVAEGNGVWREYAGGYSDWLDQRPTASAPRDAVAPSAAAATRNARPRPTESGRLSFKEQRELEALPGRIEALESEREALLARMAQADYHRTSADQVKLDRERAASFDAELEQAWTRWNSLDNRRT